LPDSDDYRDRVAAWARDQGIGSGLCEYDLDRRIWIA
jgi:hypothetical protein